LLLTSRPNAQRRGAGFEGLSGGGKRAVGHCDVFAGDLVVDDLVQHEDVLRVSTNLSFPGEADDLVTVIHIGFGGWNEPGIVDRRYAVRRRAAGHHVGDECFGPMLHDKRIVRDVQLAIAGPESADGRVGCRHVDGKRTESQRDAKNAERRHAATFGRASVRIGVLVAHHGRCSLSGAVGGCSPEGSI